MKINKMQVNIYQQQKSFEIKKKTKQKKTGKKARKILKY